MTFPTPIAIFIFGHMTARDSEFLSMIWAAFAELKVTLQAAPGKTLAEMDGFKASNDVTIGIVMRDKWVAP